MDQSFNKKKDDLYQLYSFQFYFLMNLFSVDKLLFIIKIYFFRIIFTIRATLSLFMIGHMFALGRCLPTLTILRFFGFTTISFCLIDIY